MHGDITQSTKLDINLLGPKRDVATKIKQKTPPPKCYDFTKYNPNFKGLRRHVIKYWNTNQNHAVITHSKIIIRSRLPTITGRYLIKVCIHDELGGFF